MQAHLVQHIAMKFHPCCSILHISFLLRLCNSPLLMNTTFFFHLFRGILFTFLPPFPSSNPLIYSTFHFKFTASFLINCYTFSCLYVFIHTYISLNITCWIHIVLFVCIYSGMTIWHWTIGCCGCPWEGLPLSLPSLLHCL